MEKRKYKSNILIINEVGWHGQKQEKKVFQPFTVDCGCWLWTCHVGPLLWSIGYRCMGFSSCGLWALELRLRCPAARGIFPDQGLNPCPPALAGGFLFTVPPRKSPFLLFLQGHQSLGLGHDLTSCDLILA